MVVFQQSRNFRDSKGLSREVASKRSGVRTDEMHSASSTCRGIWLKQRQRLKEAWDKGCEMHVGTANGSAHRRDVAKGSAGRG